MRNTSLLITGGLGYVGGRISKFLSNGKNLNLRIGSHRKNTRKPEWLSRGNVVPIDLQCLDKLEGACRGVDAIIHLAALNEIECVSKPENAIEINVVGTCRLLEAAEKAGVKKFIYFSTAHIYRSPLVGEISELIIPRPLHMYAITHKTAEDLVLSYHERKRLIGIVVRLSNSFGVPADPTVDRWTLLVNDLCRQIVEKGKITLKSAGMQKRDFITLTDVCRAVFHLLNLENVQIQDGIFNLGGENVLRIIEMAELIVSRCEKQLNFRPKIVLPDAKLDIEKSDLAYKIDKLKATGFSLIGNVCDEIDQTLLLCKRTFAFDGEKDK